MPSSSQPGEHGSVSPTVCRQWADVCSPDAQMPVRSATPQSHPKILHTGVSYSTFDFALCVLQIWHGGNQRVMAPLFKEGNALRCHGRGRLEQNHWVWEKHLHWCHQGGEGSLESLQPGRINGLLL